MKAMAKIAKPNGPADKTKPPAKPQGKLGFLGIIGSVMVVLAMLLVPPSLIVILVGLAPSMIYALVERRDKEAVHCVTAFNLTGILPVLGSLWAGDHSLDGVLALLANPLSWLVMYGAVVLGLGFLWVLPKGAAFVLQARTMREMAALRRAQERLVREWGDGIKPEAGAEPKAKPRRKRQAPRAASLVAPVR